MLMLIAANLAASALVCAAGTTYYVAPNGDDSRSCAQAQDISTPRRTIHAGASCLAPGSTLLIRAGVYDEEFYYTGIPSGTSWDAPVTLAAYPGERVVLRPTTGPCGGAPCRVFTFVGPQQYVVLDGLVIDAIHVQYDAVKITCSGSCSSYAHHIRIKDCEIMNAPGQGILGTLNGCELISLRIHDNGATDFDHGVYFSGNGNLIEGCELYGNAGWGIHKYPAGNNNVIRNNRVHDNARVGNRGAGIGLYGGTRNLVHDNLVYGNNYGIIAQYGEGDVRIYANTVFANANSGIYNAADGRNGVIRNNIVYGNDSGIDNLGPGTVVSDNLCQSAGVGCAVVGDPRFVDAGATPPNLQLQLSSPAIDRGADLSGAVPTTDFDGVSRPQGAGWDIGAFERAPATQPSGAYYPVSACRLIDTRAPNGSYGGPALMAGASRTFQARGHCGVPPAATAVALKVTVVSPTASGNLQILASGAQAPSTAALSYSAGQARGRNGVFGLNGGRLDIRAVQASGTAHVVVDVLGYFVP